MSAMRKFTSGQIETEAVTVKYDGVFEFFSIVQDTDPLDADAPVESVLMKREEAREVFNALGVLLRESAKWAG